MKTVGQLERELIELRRLVKELLQPKSKARVVNVGNSTPAENLFRFTLNASLATGTADADILEMDGTDTGIDADVLDPLGIFATLVTIGDAGLCLRQDGNYYVIQAECPA